MLISHLLPISCLDLRCVIKEHFCLNPILQHSQMNGFSFVCCLVWTFKAYELVKHLSHCLHGYGLSPVWLNICLLRSFILFPQIVQITFLIFGSKKAYNSQNVEWKRYLLVNWGYYTVDYFVWIRGSEKILFG